MQSSSMKFIDITLFVVVVWVMVWGAQEFHHAPKGLDRLSSRWMKGNEET